MRFKKKAAVQEVAGHVLFWLPPSISPQMPGGEWVLQHRSEYKSRKPHGDSEIDCFAGPAGMDPAGLAGRAASMLGYPVTLVRDEDDVLTPGTHRIATGRPMRAPVYLVTPA